MLLPICVTTDDTITRAEADVIESAVKVFRSSVIGKHDWQVVGNSHYARGDYGCGQWYTKNAQKDSLGRIKTDSLRALIVNEPWRKEKPHYDVFVTAYPIACKDRQVIGIAYPDSRCCIVSTSSLRQMSQTDMSAMLEIAIEHEVGHLLGAASECRKGVVSRDGHHCTDPNCIMCHDPDVRLARRKVAFCEMCTTDIERHDIMEDVGI